METSKKDFNRMLKAAKETRKNAYAPYSGFKIAAAILTKDGKIFTGANVETISYSWNTHGEQNAISAAISAGHRKFQSILLYADNSTPPTPCGACRQILDEFCHGVLEVICVTARGKIAVYQLHELLPEGFFYDKGNTKRKK